MKILLLLPKAHGGGAEKIIRELALFLARNTDNKVVLLSLLEDDKLNLTNVEHVCLHGKRVLTSFFMLYRNCISEKYDVVITTLPHVIGIFSLVKFLLPIKRPVHIARLANTYSKDLSAVGSFRHCIRRFFYKFIDLQIDSYVAVSSGVAYDYQEMFSVDASKFTTIKNPVEIPNISARDLKSKHSLNLLAAGRLVAQKNYHFMLRSLSVVNDLEFKLNVLGDGPLKIELEKMARELNLNDRVVFHGYVRDVDSWFDSSDVLLLTSDFEGMPNVILEALAHGVYVISTDCPHGPREIIGNDLKLGRLVALGDVCEMSSALRSCKEFVSDLSNVSYRRDYIKRYHSYDLIFIEYERVINDNLYG